MTTFLQATVAGLSLASIYMLLALGFVIIYKSMQVLSFAHPAVMLFAAYMVSWMATDPTGQRSWKLNFWLALFLGVVAAGLMALGLLFVLAASRKGQDYEDVPSSPNVQPEID